MPSLLETNPHLRDPEKRRRMIEEDVYESSVFEGATALKRPLPDEGDPGGSPRRKAATSKTRGKGK